MKEKTLQSKIIKWLEAQEDCFVVKQYGGKYTAIGIPDLLCCFQGKFLAFELKVKGNTTSKIQDYKIGKIRAAGGIAEVIFSLEEVQEIIKSVKELKI